MDVAKARYEFKVQFIEKCANAGLTIDAMTMLADVLSRQIADRGLKTAEEGATGGGATAAANTLLDTILGVPSKALNLLGSAWGAGVSGAKAIGDAVTTAVPYAALGAIGIPLAAGTGLAYLGSKMTDLSSETPEEVQHRELLDEYARLTDEANRAATLARRRRRQRSSYRPL